MTEDRDERSPFVCCECKNPGKATVPGGFRVCTAHAVEYYTRLVEFGASKDREIVAITDIPPFEVPEPVLKAESPVPYRNRRRRSTFRAFSDDQILAIRREFATGLVTVRQLAVSREVLVSQIYAIVTGKSYRHAPGPLVPHARGRFGANVRSEPLSELRFDSTPVAAFI